jgi:hypothetical protein
MWIAISTPYRRAGLLYTNHRDFYDTESDDTLVACGATNQFNPTIGQATTAKERIVSATSNTTGTADEGTLD